MARCKGRIDGRQCTADRGHEGKHEHPHATACAIVGWLALQDADRLWTTAEIEAGAKAPRGDRVLDAAALLLVLSDAGVIERYRPTDARPAAYVLPRERREDWREKVSALWPIPRLTAKRAEAAPGDGDATKAPRTDAEAYAERLDLLAIRFDATGEWVGLDAMYALRTIAAEVRHGARGLADAVALFSAWGERAEGRKAELWRLAAAVAADPEALQLAPASAHRGGKTRRDRVPG